MGYLISSVISFLFFLFLCSSFPFPKVFFVFQSFCSCFFCTLLFLPHYVLISVPFPYLFIRHSSLFLLLRIYSFLYLSYFSTHPIFFPLFPSLFRISSNIYFFSPPSSTSFYHFSEVFALITTKFIFPALPQRPLVIDYSSLKIGRCTKSYIYVTALRTEIIQAETLNMGEYISRFKRQRCPAEVLLSALKE